MDAYRAVSGRELGTDARAYWRPDVARDTRALQTAHGILDGEKAVADLVRYYSWESNYAGATFTCLEPDDPFQIDAADLLAVTTLSVRVEPMAIRRFTDRETRNQLSSLLRQLGPDLRLESVGPESAAVMGEFYDLVKASLRRANAVTSNAWVTASKICARKRPHLFPVRDRVVLELLGLKGSYPDDWPVFAALTADEGLMVKLDEAVSQAQEHPGVQMGDASLRLRHLDVILWMHGMAHR